VIEQTSTSAGWIAALVRSSAFAATMPVAGSGAVPRIVRGAIAFALAPAVYARLHGDTARPGWPEELITGFTFGITASVIAAAASAAGALIDTSIAMRPFGFDSVFGGPQGPFGRIYSLAFAMLFFASGAATRLCARFVDASSAAHSLTEYGAVALATTSFGASLDLAAPCIAAQLIATVAAATAARAAPRINGLMLASPAATAAVLVVVLAGLVAAFHALVALALLAASASAA
jgi:flagellar biosynthesis protein FliR